MSGAHAEPGFLSYTAGLTRSHGRVRWAGDARSPDIATQDALASLWAARRCPRWINRDLKRLAICTRSARGIHLSPVPDGSEQGALPPKPGILRGYSALTAGAA